MNIFSRLYAIIKRNAFLAEIVGANTINQIVTLICQFAILRFVPSEDIGIWQTVLLIETYLAFVRAGVVNGFNREYPFLIGKGDAEKAEQYAESVNGYTMVISLISFLIFLTYSIKYIGHGKLWLVCTIFLSILAAVHTYQSYIESTYRITSHFRILARIKITEIPLLLISLLLPWWFGVYGLLIRQLIMTLYTALLCHLFRPIKINQFKIDRGVIIKLLQVGIPLFVYGYFVTISRTFPKLIVLQKLGTEGLGLFTPIIWIGGGVTMLIGGFSSFYYPKITMLYGKKEAGIGLYTVKIALKYIVVLAPLFITGIIILPFLIEQLLPQYTSIIPSTRVVIIAGIFECASLSTIVFSSAKEWKKLYIYLACCLAIRYASPALCCLFLKDYIFAITTGMCVSSALLAVIALYLSHSIGKVSVKY